MNSASGREAKMFGMGRMSKYAARALALGMGLLLLGNLGGCKNQQQEDQMAQMNSEIASLKEEKAQLESSNSALQQQLAARPVAPPAAPLGSGMDDGGGNTGGGARPQPGRDVVIEVAGDVLFASGQTTIKPEAKKELDRIASRIKNSYAGHDIRVEGYSDKHPIKKSKFASNEALSEARAQSVEAYLVSKGISSSHITSVGKGSTKLKATDAASRRVEIVIIGR